MKIHLIWAQDKNGGIGKNGKLPWYISEDLINFKKLTLNSTIIMGRKTWESLPKKPLPKRRNIVLSSNNIHNVECYNSINNCLQVLDSDQIQKIFIIGGSTIYKEFYNIAHELHITQIEEKTTGIDVMFPISMSKIKNKFVNIYKERIAINAIYSHWIKSNIN